jgi:hypothetical protein
MSTTASTYTGPEITVESMRRAMEEIRKFPPPHREIRLHPDDLAELRLRHSERVVNFGGQLLAGNFAGALLGLPVVEDVNAPRLPRKRRE